MSDSGSERTTWRRAGEIPRVCLDRRNLRQSLAAAAVVGTILFFINQADMVFSGQATTATWIKGRVAFWHGVKIGPVAG